MSKPEYLRRRAPALTGLAAAFGLMATPAAAEMATYEMDQTHLSVVFMVGHLDYAEVVGMFLEAGGSFEFDEEALEVGDISFTIQAGSVFTNHDARDNHLRSDDFLNAAEHPEITFVGREVEQTGERTGVVHGDLTVAGVTAPVSVDVTWNKSADYPFGPPQYSMGISARAAFNRSDFGITYFLPMVEDEVEVILEFEAIRQTAPE